MSLRRYRWRVLQGAVLGGVALVLGSLAACSKPGANAIELTFIATSSAVESGVPTKLKWSSTGADRCTASGGWWGAQSTQGETATRPLAVETTFTLSCANRATTISRSLTIAVSGAAAFDAAGSFSRVIVDTQSPPDPWEKSVGDLNGDGRPDLIVAGAKGPVVWYEAPNWKRHVIAEVADSQSGSATGDIDGDGDTDVIVGTTWYENLGDGLSWKAHSLPDTAAGTHDIVVADINNDGRADIVMRGETAHTVYVFLQGKRPDTWREMLLHPSRGLNGLDVADLNGDGWLDIVVGGVWLQNPGRRRFVARNAAWRAHRFAPAWHESAQVKVIDMDADGHPDIVMSVSEAVGKLSWFRAPVDPTSDAWVEHVIDTGLDHVHSFVVADLDRDGSLDVVASEYEGPGRLILYRMGNGGWQKSVIGTDSLHNLRAADFDNDGNLDFFGVNAWGIKPVVIYKSVQAPPAKRVLVFSRTLGFRHESIPDAVAALRALGAQNGFEVEATEDASVFTPTTLARYRAVVFLSPSGEVLTAAQCLAFQQFIQAGGGFVGIHNATAQVLEHWTWYTGLVGAREVSEIPTQPMTLVVTDPSHPSTAALPSPWSIVSEAYNFDVNPKVHGARVLLNLDDTTVSGGSMGHDHPYSWYRPYDGGRSWYTVGGANSEDYRNPEFMSHLLGAIRYAGGF